MSDIRQFTVGARSTDTFGRVLCNARNHHFVIDGPVQNGCPGEAVTPVEAFLSGVAACGVELMQVIAREKRIGLKDARVEITGTVDRSNPVRADVTVFNTVQLDFVLHGVSKLDGDLLVESFKGR